MIFSWTEDRQLILRGWSLVISIIAALMMLSVCDGRIVYLEGSYTGYLGFWTDCKRNKCADVGQVTVLIHLSTGFVILALGLCLILLLCMGFSFWPPCSRITKVDLMFSLLSISIGLLILLSLLLFTINCHSLHPKPRVFYKVTFYMCLSASAMMLCAGILSYLNHLGVWRKQEISKELQMSSRRRSSMRLFRQQSSETSETMIT